jgi:hypothetical protein
MNEQNRQKIEALKQQIESLNTTASSQPAAPLQVLQGKTRIGRVYLHKHGQAWKATAVETEGTPSAEGVNMLDAAYDVMNAQIEQHNGAPNYETWLARVWMFDNDERTASNARRNARAVASTSEAADALQDYALRMTANNSRNGFLAEIIGAYFVRVDWHYLAEIAREE